MPFQTALSHSADDILKVDSMIAMNKLFNVHMQM